MLKIVVDTNLFVSAVLTSHGTPAKILELFRKNMIEIVLSEEIANEIRKVLNYPKLRKRHGWTPEETGRFIKGLKKFCIVVVPKAHSEPIVKEYPSDDKFLDCAVAGEVDYIITGDDHLLNFGQYSGIPIITPAQLLGVYKTGKV